MKATDLESILQPELRLGNSAAQELLDFLDDGIIELVSKKQDPYYAIAKNRLLQLLVVNQPADQKYVDRMIYTLNGVLINRGSDSDPSFGSTFVEICLELMKGQVKPKMFSKSTLRILNHINKSTP